MCDAPNESVLNMGDAEESTPNRWGIQLVTESHRITDALNGFGAIGAWIFWFLAGEIKRGHEFAYVLESKKFAPIAPKWS